MKKFNIFKIMFLVALSLSLVLIFANIHTPEKEVFNLNFTNSKDKLKIVSENTLSLKNITDINLQLDVDDVSFLENENSNEIKIIEKCTRDLSKEEQLKINAENNKINIHRNSNLNINSLGKSFSRQVLIYLPSTYKNDLNLKLSLGNIDFGYNVNLNKLNLNLTTGSVNIKDLKCNSFILEGRTGDFSIDTLICEEYGISLNTGSINVSDISGKGYINNTVGNIKSGISNMTGDTEISSSTGDIEVNILKEFDFIINSSCDIGEIKTDFKENSIGKNPKYTLTIDCGIGNIKINKIF